MKIAVAVVIFSTVVLDATRDAWSQRSVGVSWMDWHLVKWGAFYPALVVLSFEYLGLLFAGVLSIGCLGIWTLFYKQTNPIVGNFYLMDFARILAAGMLFLSAVYIAVKVIEEMFLT